MTKGIIPLLAAATLTVQAEAQEIQVPLAALTWQSESTNDQGLALEIEDLFLSLYNSGNLVVQKHELGKRPFAELAMRNEGQFFGSFFPAGIDAMLCDLNPNHCRRTLTQGKVDLSDPTSHVGGHAITPGRWNTKAGDTIIIPHYEFRQVTSLERVSVNSSWSHEIVPLSDSLDCSGWGIFCRELLIELNPPSKHAGEPTAVIPVLQLRTSLPLRGDAKSEIAGQLSRVTTQIDMPEVVFATTETDFSDAFKEVTDETSPSDTAINALRRNLSTIGVIEKFGLDDPLFEKQIELFKLVGHPFATLETFEDGDLAPVIVAIMDGALNTPHCDLPPLMLPDGTILEPAAVVADASGGDVDAADTSTETAAIIDAGTAEAPPTITCSEIDELALEASEHSASVIGVIASPPNGMGIVGMNPYAEFHFVPFDTDQAPAQEVQIVVDRLNQGLRFSVRVANLSFGVTPIFETEDDFRDVLESRAKRTLIVAAAGNHNQDLERKCPVLPACLNNLDNFITVVGIDRNLTQPKVWSEGAGDGAAGSNTHPQFEIAEPAIGILSTVSGNKFVEKKGTSFAAPQVTAAASLLFARAESFWADDPDVIPPGGQIPPKVVKDRLVYTSDYFPSLKGKVLGGRLNVRRALAVEQAQFQLFDREEPVIGLVTEAPNFIQCNQGNDAEQLNFWNVRRITFDEERGSHIIFSHVTDDNGNRGGELDRDPSCVMATLSPEVKVRTRVDGNFVEETFEFRNIKDYTSPMYQR